MSTQVVVVTVPHDMAEIVADRMWQWGVQAVSETRVAGGRTEISTSVGNDRDAIARAISTLDPSWHVERRDVDDSIAQVAPEFLSPTRYAPGMITVPASLLHFESDDDSIVTVIDPGSAFGLGDHPTTRTAMALLADLLRTDGADIPRSLLDVGCGTGALALLAAQLGVPRIRAIDIADAAVEATRHNMELNQVVGMIDVDTAPIADLVGTYDIVVANILAPVLVAMADDLRRLVKPGGALVISGILDDRHDHVLAALAPLAKTASLSLDGWVSIVLR